MSVTRSERARRLVRRKVLFFATPSDISPALVEFESRLPLKFVLMGEWADVNRPIYLTSEEIPEPGIATHESAIRSRAYMVSRREIKNHLRVSNHGGRKGWNLFSADNEGAVVLTLGGLWTTGTLLPGMMDSMHDNAMTKELLSAFSAALKKQGFKKVDRLWWLGAEAMEMLRAGKRLTKTAEQSPPAFDLKI
jgi:hypothetical protein